MFPLSHKNHFYHFLGVISRFEVFYISSPVRAAMPTLLSERPPLHLSRAAPHYTKFKYSAEQREKGGEVPPELVIYEGITYLYLGCFVD